MCAVQYTHSKFYSVMYRRIYKLPNDTINKLFPTILVYFVAAARTIKGNIDLLIVRPVRQMLLRTWMLSFIYKRAMFRLRRAVVERSLAFGYLHFAENILLLVCGLQT